jgi:hypothetical protein
MKKKNEDVAHERNGIKSQEPCHSWQLGNSPSTGKSGSLSTNVSISSDIWTRQLCPPEVIWNLDRIFSAAGRRAKALLKIALFCAVWGVVCGISAVSPEIRFENEIRQQYGQSLNFSITETVTLEESQNLRLIAKQAIDCLVQLLVREPVDFFVSLIHRFGRNHGGILAAVALIKRGQHRSSVLLQGKRFSEGVSVFLRG